MMTLWLQDENGGMLPLEVSLPTVLALAPLMARPDHGDRKRRMELAEHKLLLVYRRRDP